MIIIVSVLFYASDTITMRLSHIAVILQNGTTNLRISSKSREKRNTGLPLYLTFYIIIEIMV